MFSLLYIKACPTSTECKFPLLEFRWAQKSRWPENELKSVLCYHNTHLMRTSDPLLGQLVNRYFGVMTFCVHKFGNFSPSPLNLKHFVFVFLEVVCLGIILAAHSNASIAWNHHENTSFQVKGETLISKYIAQTFKASTWLCNATN